MKTNYYRVLKEFVEHPSGRYYPVGSIYIVTTYHSNPYIRSMIKYGFIEKASTTEAMRAEQRRLKKINRWARNARP